MQKMRIKNGKEWIDDYEFVAFGLGTEHYDGMWSIYTMVICKDPDGFLEEKPLSEVQFYV